MPKVVVTFWLGILFLVIGCVWVLYVNYLQRKVKQSLSWPSVQGEMVRSELVQRTTGSGVSGNSTTYRAEVEYNYQVRARSYRGDKVCIGVDVGTGSLNRGEERGERYPVKSPVTVYYNPDNPQEACLERKVDAPFFLYLIGGAFGFFGLLMATGWVWQINVFIHRTGRSLEEWLQ
jgi:hypothetical protein